MIHIYTDGSCRKNGVGAHGFVAVNDVGDILHTVADRQIDTTNQQQELLAIIRACQWAAATYGDFGDFCIYSDSAYCINCWNDKWYVKWINNGWRTSNNGDVKNQALWEELIPFYDDARFTFKKVKGHHGVKLNEMVDKMVQELSSK